MKYAAIKKNDIANGPGVRVSLFVSGCNHHCKGCFNEIAWDFNYGTPFTEETIKEILDSMSPVHIKGLTLLGGEPLDPANQGAILSLIKKVKSVYPDKTIWCFTGYDFEKEIMCDMIQKVPETKSLINLIDVLVDGRFEIDKKDITLRFRGSSNQRIIDMNKTRAAGNVVLWDEQETL
ncbi:MAG: anaerobic ribonucleoside-triphosphate reductase activating protein [Eubacterium sp.]|nr:anaerobic ribonucleoside-triphosphate reductase activating protein [Eubacterium sp.]